MDLRLAPLKPEHLEHVRQWRMSEEVTRYMYTDPVLTAEDQRRWYEDRVRADRNARWWVIQADGVAIGVVNIVQIDALNRRCAWGYYLGETAYRGKGIAKRVERTVYDYAFDTLKLHKVTGEVLAFNTPVVELHQRFGCVVEGRLRQHIRKQGEFHDVVVVGLLRDEWQRIRDSLGVEPIPIEPA